ncbi:MAG: molybdenum ABC transporter ATP-binding protein [Desulfotalea sp.]
MLLEVDIERNFPGFNSNVKFSITGNRCGVFGPSGSGKSTLMNMLAGLVEPDSGSIKLNGKILFNKKLKINMPPEQRKVGVVFQHGHLFPHMNVGRNLYYGYKRNLSEGRNLSPEKLISILQLEPLLKRQIAMLSGGEKQRVALGRTILSCPDLILMDEPLSGLDGQLKYQIIPHLQEVLSTFSIPIIFISHSLQEMRMMTENVVVLGNGKVEQQLSIEELAKSTLGSGGRGYINLLQLDNPVDHGDLYSYSWGSNELMLLKSGNSGKGQFSLNSRNILLFKKHPEATSARNMLPCTVLATYQTDWLVGVELDCNGKTMIVEIVPKSVDELGIKKGVEVIAVIKASAFEKRF